MIISPGVIKGGGGQRFLGNNKSLLDLQSAITEKRHRTPSVQNA